MKNIYPFFLLFLLGCASGKSVLICGDHICINDSEAKRYFEENLSLEVKILNNKEKENIDLVELNLNTNKENLDKQISEEINLLKESKATENLKKLIGRPIIAMALDHPVLKRNN